MLRARLPPLPVRPDLSPRGPHPRGLRSGQRHQANSSGFVDVGLVYTKDVNANNGKAFSDTPGHFTQFSCDP